MQGTTSDYPTVWNLKLLGSGDDDPRFAKEREIIEKANLDFAEKWRERSDYLENPEILREALDEYELIARNFGTSGNEEYYVSLRTAQDETDPKLKGWEKKIEEFATRLENETRFFLLSIAKIPSERQGDFLAHPALAPYRNLLAESFEFARYLLSEPEEKILTMMSAPGFGNWVRMTSEFIAREESEVTREKGAPEKLNFSRLMSRTSDPDRAARDEAAKLVNEILARHAPAAEHELNAILEWKKKSDELRGVPRPDLLRHIGNGLGIEAADALVASVAERFDISRRHYALKARLLALPGLEYHERNLAYGSLEGKRYTYDEAVALVERALGALSPRFREIFFSFVENGLIDVFPRAKKSDGAFCAHRLKSQPSYILMNFGGKLRDVLTLAHEVGHGINNELMRERRNALSFDSPLAVAEVASTFMEDFVLDSLAREADDELRLALMVAKLDDDVATIFRQIACYRFELAIHEAYRAKGYLPKEEIGALFLEQMTAYLGPTVRLSEGSANWWVYWSHIRSFFYVYSYASGLIISKSLQQAVRADPRKIEAVIEILSAGSSAPPKETFARAGIEIADPAFWSQGLAEVERLLSETETLAQKLGKA